MQRARKGQVDAFETLVRRYRAPALRVAYTIAPSEAEDAVQEAFIKAYRALPRFRPGAAFRPWVLRIVANEARNCRRATGRRSALDLRVAERPTAPAFDGSPEDAALAHARRAALAAAVASLPERDRTVIAYRWFAGLTEAEMADALGCAPGTVKSRLARALDRLRAVFTDEIEEQVP